MGTIFSTIGDLISSLFRTEIVMQYNTQAYGDIFDGGSGLMWILIIAVAVIFWFSDGEAGAAVLGAIVGFVGYAALCGLWFVIVCWIAPFVVNTIVFIAGIALIAAVLCGSIVALVNYVRSFVDNVNPYADIHYQTHLVTIKSQRKGKRFSNVQENAKKRSYFFGPGFYSLKRTLIDVWSYNFGTISAFKDFIDGYGTIGWILGILPLIFFAISVSIAGSVATIVFSAMHISIIIPIMVIIYVLFTISWFVDRIYLLYKSIQTNCVCQHRVVIPYFYCSNPNCRKVHTKLVPGVYGIWHRECVCGEKLPTMFMLGRSKLESCCPNCQRSLITSSSSQFAVSVVGGTSSGKTVWLAAFWHELFKRIQENVKYISYEIPSEHKSKFEQLDDMYHGERSLNTDNKGRTAIMQSVLLSSGSFKANKQFSLYDISGESFNSSDLGNIIPQKQFKDSNGIVFIVDPLSSEKMRKIAENNGDSIVGSIRKDPTDVLNNFATYMTTVLTSWGITRRINKPLAVVITKVDLPSIQKYISEDTINRRMLEHPDQFKTAAEACDAVCMDFLNEIGLDDLVKVINTRFTDVRYFPISAIGHVENGKPYEPKHVLEPIEWIIEKTDKEINNVFKKIENKKSDE